MLIYYYKCFGDHDVKSVYHTYYAEPVSLDVAGNIILLFCLKTKQIKGLGYPLKTYQIWTVDKYRLGLERIPYSKRGNGVIGTPVLLLHGLYLSSAIFAINNSSLSEYYTFYNHWLYCLYSRRDQYTINIGRDDVERLTSGVLTRPNIIMDESSVYFHFFFRFRSLAQQYIHMRLYLETNFATNRACA